MYKTLNAARIFTMFSKEKTCYMHVYFSTPSNQGWKLGVDMGKNCLFSSRVFNFEVAISTISRHHNYHPSNKFRNKFSSLYANAFLLYLLVTPVRFPTALPASESAVLHITCYLHAVLGRETDSINY
jgi:hypothetical protein